MIFGGVKSGVLLFLKDKIQVIHLKSLRIPKSLGNSQVAKCATSCFGLDDADENFLPVIGDAARASRKREPASLLRIARSLVKA